MRRTVIKMIAFGMRVSTKFEILKMQARVENEKRELHDMDTAQIMAEAESSIKRPHLERRTR